MSFSTVHICPLTRHTRRSLGRHFFLFLAIRPKQVMIIMPPTLIVIVDLTKAIRELGLSKSESLKLQLVPVGSDGQVTFEKVEIRGI